MDQSMVVTCDHCGTRYKLDSSRIPGRGARVTCPSCRHVFVVYRKEPKVVPAPEPIRAASTPDPSQLDPDTINFRDVGISSWKVKVKIGLVYDFNDVKTIRKNLREGRITRSDLISYNGQDWNPIGTMRDLDRYFGRVYLDLLREQEEEEAGAEIPEDAPTHIMESGPAQLTTPRSLTMPSPTMSSPTMSSPSMSSPTPVATSSPSIAAPAVVMPAAMAAGSEKAGPEEAVPEEDSVEEELAAAFSAAVAEVGVDGAPVIRDLPPNGNDRSTGAPRFVDPFEARANQRRRPRDAGRPKPPSSPGSRGSGSRILGGVLLLALAVGGVYYAVSNGLIPGGATAEVTTPDTVVDDPEATERIQREVIEELGGEDAVRDEMLPDEEKARFPVRPKNISSPRGNQIEGLNGSFSVAGPGGAALVSNGSQAAQRGDWRSAAQSYERALQQDPDNLQLLEMLGEAQFRTERYDAARGTFLRARGVGSTRADRWLGDIAFQVGDINGANEHYQRYLETNPPDSADIKQRIAELSERG
ncbi:MAG: zinc-ribbon domain-containing protein [Myxococcota bacterium]